MSDQQQSLFSDAVAPDSPGVSTAAPVPKKKSTVRKTAPKAAPVVAVPEDDTPSFFSVSDITRFLRDTIASDPLLGGPVTVRGELSNIKTSSRGHVYLTLKDEQAALSGILWASTAIRLPFVLEEGLDVFATGQLEIYAPNGSYSLVVKKMEPVGVGALQLAFQQLKEKLSAEGLFDEAHKKPLPDFPRRVGIITSRTGAVIHDMLRVLRRKNPQVDVLICPVAVQGETAAADIARAVTELNRPEYALDVLIVARGGGSFEDLFCFSDEAVVRAIFNSRLPVITGIGHEPDFGLADAVADFSAATPTAAAEAAVPDLALLQKECSQTQTRLLESMWGYLLFYEQWLDQAATRFIDAHRRILERTETRLGQTRERLLSAMTQFLEKHTRHLQHAAAELDALSPLKTLARGYAVVTTEADHVIASIAKAQPGQRIRVRLYDGTLINTIEEVIPHE